MGIIVEFNPDLALRNYREFEKGNRKKDECIPRHIEAGNIYSFLKKDQRNYWFNGEIPLVETKGNGILSKPLASVRILEATHMKIQKSVYTKGKYQVMQVFHDNKIHFNGFEKV